MLNCLKDYILDSLVFLGAFAIWAQELPPIDYYPPETYGAENQNWGISQSEEKFLYVANNVGLLQFNGASWKLYPSPNQTIIRSVKCIDDRIYSGCYMEFGYWEKNTSNQLTYNSLSSKLNVPLIEDEQFWQIYEIDGYIAFCSLNRIYFYDIKEQRFQISDPGSSILKTFKVGNTIYFQNTKGELIRFINGKTDLVLSDDDLGNMVIINILEAEEYLLFIMEKGGIYKFQSYQLSVYDSLLNQNLNNPTIYSAIRLKDGRLALGTISNGLYIINNDKGIDFHIKQDNGLGNNTVLNLLQDVDNNLWLCLDNGINVLNIDSPFRIYSDINGELGTVYASLATDEYLYLGTNQGLFYKRRDDKEKFKFVDGTKGQVWYLRELDGEILCGHNQGTFVVKNGVGILALKEPGAWDIKSLPQSDLFLQGNYSGLFTVEHKNNEWQIKNKIKNFNISSRTFEVLDHTVFLNHEYKGIYKLELDEPYESASGVEKLILKDQAIHSGLAKFRDTILYFNDSGIYKYHKDKERFQKDRALTRLVGTKDFSSGKLIVDSINDRVWSFSFNDIKYITSGSISNNEKVVSIPLNISLRKEFVGFENLLNIDGNTYLFGTSQGYIIFNLDRFEEKEHSIHLNEISVYDKNYTILKINTSTQREFNNEQNNIEFNFSIPEYDKYIVSQYRYRLKGYMKDWSDWSEKSMVQFKNLPFGEYQFELQGRVGQNVVKDAKTYRFRILRPWYLSTFMVVTYFLGLLAFSAFMHLLYRNYYNKQQEKLLLRNEKELAFQQMENEKQRIQFENERLQKNIESKNRELAISTMSLIKKNEFLNDLKEEISKMNKTKDSERLSKIVDSKINNDDDWEFFEEAFNNADQYFLRNIKEKHPTLTNNDLRLCAYLRLNLTSKEISPLLNITYRSVEIKRYRLRKKMNLSHEVGLTEYILSI